MPRQRVNLINKDDLEVTPIRGSGPGGQHRNKNYTGVRITHKESGAVGEATDSKSQTLNRAMAFRRMIGSPEFQVWLNLQIHPEHLKIEIRKGGEWQPI